MVFCDHCLIDVAEKIIDDGYLCCGHCGKVLEDHNYSRKSVFCDHCCKNVYGIRLDDDPLCCGDCGKFLEENCLVRESHVSRGVAKEVDDYVPNGSRFFYWKLKLWEYDNEGYLQELAAKEKIAKKAFQAFFRNCSNDSLAARDKLAQSAIESLEKSRKKQTQIREKLQKVASKNDNISESMSKEKTKEDELGSFDEFKHTSYQENAGRKKRLRRFVPRICK